MVVGLQRPSEAMSTYLTSGNDEMLNQRREINAFPLQVPHLFYAPQPPWPSFGSAILLSPGATHTQTYFPFSSSSLLALLSHLLKTRTLFTLLKPNHLFVPLSHNGYSCHPLGPSKMDKPVHSPNLVSKLH